MDEKIKRENFRTLEVLILVFLTFSISLVIGILVGRKTTFNNASKKDKNLNDFIENYNYITENYYTEIDKEKIINGAIEGMMASLEDSYSMYFDSEESNNLNIVLSGEYEGLGIQYGKETNSNKFVILSVFKDSPAAKKGIRVNDIILSIDDKNLSGEDIDINELTNYINKNNKLFKLKISRDGKEIDFEISKSKIDIKSVNSNVYKKNNKKIGYIYISVFASNTYYQFKNELQMLEKEKIDSLIIDVRQNTGGHLVAVEKILNEFLTKKQISFILEEKNKQTNYYGKAKTNKKYPIVLLGDGGSASASEVLISSLKDNLGSYFIGEKTYGKGSVQELITLSNGSQYKITTQKWMTPKNNCVSDSGGITPDKEVKLSDRYYEFLDESEDNQLQEAINYLIQK